MESETNGGHRSGFVALLGKPNVGKSTLLNALVGHNLAPVSRKPQTTQRQQLGILNLRNAQIIFQDTPGLHKAHNKMGEFMNQSAVDAIQNADLLMALFDSTQDPDADDYKLQDWIASSSSEAPILVSLTKIDACESSELADRVLSYSEVIAFQGLIKISALTGYGLDELLSWILARLPIGPPLYEEDLLTLTSERELAADLIRAAALEILRQEVPYSIAVRIDEYKERGDYGAYIPATMFVERESQKGIVIGKGGSTLKQIGIAARREIERMSGRKVHLELRVKVLKGWKNNPRTLRNLGYHVKNS